MVIELYKSKVKSYKAIYIINCNWWRCHPRNIKFYFAAPHFRVEFIALGIAKWNGSIEFRFLNICIIAQY